jgi:hypothetical protein
MENKEWCSAAQKGDGSSTYYELFLRFFRRRPYPPGAQRALANSVQLHYSLVWGSSGDSHDMAASSLLPHSSRSFLLSA